MFSVLIFLQHWHVIWETVLNKNNHATNAKVLDVQSMHYAMLKSHLQWKGHIEVHERWFPCIFAWVAFERTPEVFSDCISASFLLCVCPVLKFSRNRRKRQNSILHRRCWLVHWQQYTSFGQLCSVLERPAQVQRPKCCARNCHRHCDTHNLQGICSLHVCTFLYLIILKSLTLTPEHFHICVCTYFLASGFRWRQLNR